ncbi:MAG TPA: ATP-binding protein, partial [Gammaproteobacteria bacterium]|nr:ATP-binding protein [Gammaproteobacteria bacterium]
MPTQQQILIGKGDQHVFLDPRYANRHGLIAGATGTGKTVSLQVLAEGFSSLGVPVFMADVKGDLSGLGQAGEPHPKIDERISAIGMDNYTAAANPV